jgi:hypothetical protein
LCNPQNRFRADAARDAGFAEFLGATECYDPGCALLLDCENRALPASGKGFENWKLFEYTSFAPLGGCGL